jgi:hypothetical protein
MATAITLISSVTVGSGGAANIQFTSIPATYTDLLIKTSLRSSSASGNSNFFINFNGVYGTSYSQKRLLGDGTTGSSNQNSAYPWVEISGVIPNTTYTANTFASGHIYITNYAGSAYKSVSADFAAENNASTAYAYLVAGLFSDATAISSILLDGTDNFVQHSTAYLYGISNA